MAHLDPVIVTLVIDGEVIHTTPAHSFYANGHWVDAGKLHVGDTVRKEDGTVGDVESISVAHHSQVMYNLTVEHAHTFFVGSGQWLVHNAGCSFLGKSGQDVFNVLTDGQTLTKNEALDAGIAFLGDGYKQLDVGVYVSADGTRMFRMTDSDILGTHGAKKLPHVNLETVKPVKKWDGTTTYQQIDNKHIYFSD